jgi:hypothetical protein
MIVIIVIIREGYDGDDADDDAPDLASSYA